MNAEEPDGAWVRLRRGFAATFVQHDGTAERVKVCANQSLAISDDGFGYLYNTDTDADAPPAICGAVTMPGHTRCRRANARSSIARGAALAAPKAPPGGALSMSRRSELTNMECRRAS